MTQDDKLIPTKEGGAPNGAEERAKGKREGWSFRFEMWVAISTVVTALVTGYQGCLTRESLNLTRQSNDATIQALEDARRNRREDLRIAADNDWQDGSDPRADRIESKRVADKALARMLKFVEVTEAGNAISSNVAKPQIGLEVLPPLTIERDKTFGPYTIKLTNTGLVPAVDVRRCVRFFVEPEHPNYKTFERECAAPKEPFTLVKDKPFPLQAQPRIVPLERVNKLFATKPELLFLVIRVRYREGLGLPQQPPLDWCWRWNDGSFAPCTEAENNRKQ